MEVLVIQNAQRTDNCEVVHCYALRQVIYCNRIREELRERKFTRGIDKILNCTLINQTAAWVKSVTHRQNLKGLVMNSFTKKKKKKR